MRIMNDFDTSSAAASATSAGYAAQAATASSGRRGQHDRPGQTRVIALDGAASLSLPVDRHDRILRLEQGQLWLTNTRRELAPTRPRVGAGQIDELDPASGDVAGRDTSDVWLAPGDSMHLPAGSHWVLQAWPEARLKLCTASVGVTIKANSGARATGLGWMQRLVAAARQGLPHHARQPTAQAGVGLRGAGCN
jgi:hypothetical protein